MRLGREHYVAAAQAFADAARESSEGASRTELTWSSAECWLRGQEYANATPLLEQLQPLSLSVERRAQVLVALAEAYQGQASQLEDERAKKALVEKGLRTVQEALLVASPPTIAVRAKYLLGLMRIERREWTEAEAALKEVATMALLAPEPLERRQALFALGWLLYQTEQYAEAARYFRDAVERYPHDRRAPLARYWLAECYRQAVPKEERLAAEADLGPYRERHRQLKKQQLEKALTQFQQLAQDLGEAQSQRSLTAEEQALLREARFGAADCLFRLEGRSPEGIAVFNDLTRIYAGRVEGLLALTKLVLCYAQQNMTEKAQSAWSEANELLGRLSDDDLKPTERKQWQEWLEQQAKHLWPARAESEERSTPK
jgi:TolA-binding protein